MMLPEDRQVAPFRAHDVNISSTDDDLTVATEFTAMGDPSSVYAREIFVGVGGDVKAQMVGDTAGHVYKNVPSGAVLSGLFTKVIKVGTTATNMVARQ